MKAVIDTNVLLSMLFGKTLSDIREALKHKKFKLECAFAGNADYIVTGDKDLLILNPFEGIKIINPNQFGKII